MSTTQQSVTIEGVDLDGIIKCCSHQRDCSNEATLIAFFKCPSGCKRPTYPLCRSCWDLRLRGQTRSCGQCAVTAVNEEFWGVRPL